MAGEDRAAPHPVTPPRGVPVAGDAPAGFPGADGSRLAGVLRESPWELDFFQAVRRLECLRPDSAPLGSSSRLSDDPVRFGQEPSLAFAPSTVAGWTEREGAPPRMLVYFLGLLGPNGPLPLHMTEYARDRIINAQDPALARFLDTFHHRMIALFYRAWALNQKAVSFERAASDRIGAYVASLFGLGMESLRGRDAVPDVGKQFHAGYLCCQTRHAAGLRALLEDYFGLPTRLVEFVGRWMDVPAEARCRVGTPTARLGATAIVGERLWECQQRFRVRFGPMTLTQDQRLLPGGPSQARLAAWIADYIGHELEWDAQLVLLASEVPEVRLGGLGAGGRLGWTTWVRSGPTARDRDDLVLRPKLN